MKRRRNLPEHLVGINDQVEAVMDILTRDVPYVVIHGMGGIDKTTLASAVFNRISNQFDGCSFLSDVRESAQRGRIIDLQKQMLSEILYCGSPEIHNSDEGINIISERFRYKKVLLVLDDVDKQDQLSKLAGKSYWFGPGSKIIITTRNVNFLPIKDEDAESSWNQARSKEYEIYEMAEMDSSDALKLFSQHALGMDSPPLRYEDISLKITNKTGGLPLALEVIGSSLFGKGRRTWEGTLSKLDSMPNQDVFKKLKISYDILDRAQKEIFLDIACYFIGKGMLHPCYMWEASGYFPKVDLLVLARMSLIKIEKDDMLWMHDQLRDFGREIIRLEDDERGNHSRLWEPEIALKVVQRIEGTDKIVALRLTGLSKVHNFTDEEFSKLPNLRFLELEGGNLEGDFENLLSKLTWLSWSCCPSELKAKNLCLEKLAVLELSESDITEDWTGWGSCLMSEDLKVVQITRCPNLKRTPDFSKCSNLKRLVLQDCTTLLVVDGSLSKLERLKHLQICVMVLPERDVMFPPINLATLSHLRTLEITCVKPRSLMGLPSSLEELTLYDVESPIDRSLFSNSANLSSLCLCKCRLGEVEFDDVLGQQLEKLCSLEVRDGELLERLSVARLKGLRRLSVFGCPKLMDSQFLEELKSLEALSIHECSSIRLLPQLSELRNLRRLHLKNCPLQNLSDLRLPDTCHLMIEGCGAFPSFDGDYKKWKDTLSGPY
ncbi:disease resistance protein L6-like isoform X2 [Rhodamnia argentea]|uniref:Disease resistance protein L6-like isoform X2 n=1 Tax=Rhodamnia argentea TaxID=178133 RepID=A0ABM3GZC0_9MYRT|nr:disease resistance protein L6-like isoform X2 [Rhodamnia argentea]